MKKIMLIFVFMGFNVGAMEEDLSKQIARTIASFINFNVEKESDKKYRIVHAEKILNDFMKEYPQENVRDHNFVMLVEHFSKKDIDDLEKKIELSDQSIWAIKNIRSSYNAVECLNNFLDKYIDKTNLKQHEKLILKMEGIDSLILYGVIGKKYREKIIENIFLKNNLLQDYKNFITTDFICDSKDMLPVDIDFTKERIKSGKESILLTSIKKYVKKLDKDEKDIIKKFLVNPHDITEKEFGSINLFLLQLMEKIYFINQENKNDLNYLLVKDFLQDILAALQLNQFCDIILYNVKLATNNMNEEALFLCVLDILKRYDRDKKQNLIEKINRITQFFNHDITSLMFNENFKDVKQRIYEVAKGKFDFMIDQTDGITKIINTWQKILPEKIVHVQKKSWSTYFFNKKAGIFLGISTLAMILFYVRKRLQHALLPSPANPAPLPIPQKNIDLKELLFIFNNNS